jgi:hypothetical protein
VEPERPQMTIRHMRFACQERVLNNVNILTRFFFYHDPVLRKVSLMSIMKWNQFKIYVNATEPEVGIVPRTQIESFTSNKFNLNNQM